MILGQVRACFRMGGESNRQEASQQRQTGLFELGKLTWNV